MTREAVSFEKVFDWIKFGLLEKRDARPWEDPGPRTQQGPKTGIILPIKYSV